MAGRKRRTRPGYKAQRARYLSNNCKIKNKEARALRHELLVEKEAEKKAATTKLFDKVCAMYKLNSKGKYALKRLIGTINQSRLQAVLDKTLSKQPWFAARLDAVMPMSKNLEVRLDTNASALIKTTKLGQFI